MSKRRRLDTAAIRLGLRVRQLRNEREWSQERLAAEAALDRSYLAGIETGARNPSLKALQRLSGALQVNLADLFIDVSAGKPF